MSLLCDPGSKAGLGGSKENLGENVRHGMEQPEGLKSCYARTDKSRYGKAEHVVTYGRGSISCPHVSVCGATSKFGCISTLYE